MKIIKFIILFISVGIFAQTKNVNQLLVFQPDENSVKFNEVYTENFFFGNFGIKPLINAIPIDNQKVKSIKISAETEGKTTPNVFELNYDKEGKLTQMKISEMLSGKALTVNYVYKDGLIQEEIFKSAEGTKSNKFHYAEGKMIVENTKGMIDVYQLKGKILYKTVYIGEKPVFKDRMEGKCRITSYNQQDIDKTCYGNFNEDYPLTIDEFTNSENAKTGKAILVPGTKWAIKTTDNKNFSVLSGETERYRLELNGNSKIKEFDFMGSKSEQKKPIHFSFKYEMY